MKRRRGNTKRYRAKQEENRAGGGNLGKDLKKLFTYLPDAYYLHDLKGNIVDLNKRAEELIGYSKRDLKGKNFLKLKVFPSDQLPKVAALLTNSTVGNAVGPDEIVLRRRDGKKCIIEMYAAPIRLQGKRYALVLGRDVTQRAQVDEEIKSLANFTTENPQAALRIAKDGTLLYSNAASMPLLISWGSRIGEVVPEEWRQLVTDVLDSGMRENVECELRGQIFSFIVVPVADTYVNLYGRDITDHKRAEERLRTAYTELKETHSQLIQAEKMNVVGRLASGVAHEVKNPLAVILQGVEYLNKNIEPKDANISSILEYMEKAVHKADSTVRGLLDFSSLSALEMKPEDIRAVLEGALTLVKHQCDRCHINIIREFGKGIPHVDVDKNRMEQVFVNLFMNAIHAMPDGGWLTVKTYSEKLSRHEGSGRGRKGMAGVMDTAVVVEIDDTGRGIPEEFIDRVFDPFFTTRPGKGGTGLGLSIVKNIMDMHHGNIEIRNRDEGGLKAIITLRS